MPFRYLPVYDDSTMGTRTRLATMGNVIGVVAGTALGLVSLRAPIIVGGGFMPEEGYAPPSDGKKDAEADRSWTSLLPQTAKRLAGPVSTVRNAARMVSRNRVVLFILAIGFVHGL